MTREERIAHMLQGDLPGLMRIRQELLKRRPSKIMSYAGFNPDPWQKKLIDIPPKRGLILTSRQVGKSTTVGAITTNVITKEPGALVLLLSPSQRQSGELFRKVLDFYNSAGKPIPTVSETALGLELENGARVVSLPGKGKTVRSFSGVRLIIIDEASLVEDELYHTVRPMLAVSGGSIILLSTPFGKRGFFHREWESGSNVWERVMITADQCPRISKEFLAEELEALGDWWYRQEYFCEFMDTTDSPFTFEQIQAILCEDTEPMFDEGVLEYAAS